MSVIKAPDENITMVAFYGQKPAELLQLISGTFEKIEEILEKLGLPPEVFAPYEEPQIHATIIGMGVIKIGGQLYNANFLNNNGQLRAIQPNRLLSLLAAIAGSRSPLFTIRFGGFRKSYCKCTGFDLYDWKCASSNSEFHGFERSAYEGSFYAFSPGPVMLTGWSVKNSDNVGEFTRYLYGFRRAAKDCGFLDKYHLADKPHFKDDDFYLRLGTFGKCPTPVFDSFVEQVRDFLCLRGPTTLDVELKGLSVVYYKHPSLKHVVDEIPLVDAIKDPTKVKSLYKRWSDDHL